MNMKFILTFVAIATMTLVSNVTSMNVTLGVILPEEARYPWSLKRVMPAIYYAVDTIHERGLLQDVTLVPMYKDSQCSETMGPLAAIDFHMHLHAHVLFGPVCDYAVAPVARFSPHWNIPVISAGALVTDFDNKSEYKLLTRVHGAYTNAADFFLDIAYNFNWTTLGLIYHDNTGTSKGKSSCYFRMEALFFNMKDLFRKTPWYKSFDENIPSTQEFDKILKEASLSARSSCCILISR